jgi:hypothetical protein
LNAGAVHDLICVIGYGQIVVWDIGAVIVKISHAVAKGIAYSRVTVKHA